MTIEVFPDLRIFFEVAHKIRRQRYKRISLGYGSCLCDGFDEVVVVLRAGWTCVFHRAHTISTYTEPLELSFILAPTVNVVEDDIGRSYRTF